MSITQGIATAEKTMERLSRRFAVSKASSSSSARAAAFWPARYSPWATAQGTRPSASSQGPARMSPSLTRRVSCSSPSSRPNRKMLMKAPVRALAIIKRVNLM